MNSKDLALRDPAAAALMGILGSGGSADFGAEYGADFGDGFGDDVGGDFGDDVGADFGAGAALTPAQQQAAVAAWRQRAQSRKLAMGRVRQLDPNIGSSVKIERYIFPISQTITIGNATPQTLDLKDSPDTKFRPQRVTSNAPQPMFATISELKMANVSVSIGGGAIDAYQWNANGQGQELDMPTLEPSNRARATGTYYGGAVAGVANGSLMPFCLTFVGPSRLAG
jgi:hypothetical protein